MGPNPDALENLNEGQAEKQVAADSTLVPSGHSAHFTNLQNVWEVTRPGPAMNNPQERRILVSKEGKES